MTTATHSAPPNANDLLMGGGVPSAKFAKIGDSVTGTIAEPPKTTQQSDPATGELKTWQNGDPRWQVVVTLQTEERDGEIEDDDGRRRVYVKNNLQKAVSDAVRKSGAKGLEVGGVLTVTHTGIGVAERKGMNPPKLYSAEYVSLASVALNDPRSDDNDAPPAMKYATYAEALEECLSVKITDAEFKAALAKGGFKKWNEAASTFTSGFITNTVATRGLKKQNAPLSDDDIPF